MMLTQIFLESSCLKSSSLWLIPFNIIPEIIIAQCGLMMLWARKKYKTENLKKNIIAIS